MEIVQEGAVSEQEEMVVRGVAQNKGMIQDSSPMEGEAPAPAGVARCQNEVNAMASALFCQTQQEVDRFAALSEMPLGADSLVVLAEVAAVVGTQMPEDAVYNGVLATMANLPVEDLDVSVHFMDMGPMVEETMEQNGPAM